jgi:hypothetical protein
MRITFQRSGGVGYFPGLNRPVTLDCDQMPAEHRAELEHLIGAARFFSLPAEVGKPPPGARDMRDYTVTIEDRGRTHTVRFSENYENPEVAALVERLRHLADAARTSPPNKP